MYCLIRGLRPEDAKASLDEPSSLPKGRKNLTEVIPGGAALADLKFLSGQRFECTECARCCRGWRVLVDKASQRQVAGTPLEQRLVQEKGRPTMRRDADGSL